jgi:hypothetical protein
MYSPDVVRLIALGCPINAAETPAKVKLEGLGRLNVVIQFSTTSA